MWYSVKKSFSKLLENVSIFINGCKDNSDVISHIEMWVEASQEHRARMVHNNRMSNIMRRSSDRREAERKQEVRNDVRAAIYSA